MTEEKALSTMPDRSRTLAIAATLAGAAAMAAGAFALAKVGNYLATTGKLPGTMGGRGQLMIAEISLCGAFALATLACLAIASGTGIGRSAATALAALKLAALGAILGLHWNVWYFMLDLRGPDSLSIFLVIASGLQAALLILTALTATAAPNGH